MSTEDFAMLEVAYLLVLVLVKLKSEEERAEHVWGYGMTRGLAVVRDVCTLLFPLGSIVKIATAQYALLTVISL